MSAWMLDAEHLRVILYFAGAGNPRHRRDDGAYVPVPVDAGNGFPAGRLMSDAVEYVYVSDETASRIGQVLKDQNSKSMIDLYGDRLGADEIALMLTPFEYRRPVGFGMFWDDVHPLTPGDAAQAVASYEYQACESADWISTIAREITGRIALHIARTFLPQSEDGAGWSISGTEEVAS